MKTTGFNGLIDTNKIGFGARLRFRAAHSVDGGDSVFRQGLARSGCWSGHHRIGLLAGIRQGYAGVRRNASLAHRNPMIGERSQGRASNRAQSQKLC